MRKIDRYKELLNKILEDHLHWLNKDVEGWEDMKADLSYINLGRTNLRCVNLSGANLNDSNLRGADLSHADLSNADLSYINLSDANLRYADLSGAILDDANLSGADLSCTNLRYADLSGAILDDANLSGADLSGTKGTLIEFRKGKMLTKDIIGYKKCRGGVIVKLLIPRGAIVFSINGRKCRTNKAKVLEIEGATRAISQHKYMSYYVGDEFTVYDFNCEYNVECAPGIHFFMTRKEAMNY